MLIRDLAGLCLGTGVVVVERTHETGVSVSVSYWPRADNTTDEYKHWGCWPGLTISSLIKIIIEPSL